MIEKRRIILDFLRNEIITEYFIDGKWDVVNSVPSKGIVDLSYLYGEPKELLEEEKRIIYYPEKKDDGIWFSNKKGLPKFKNIDGAEEDFEPIYESLAETRFFIGDEFGEIIGCPELTESLNRMNDDMMYFNLNWIPEELNPTPLKKVLELMNKKIEAEIIFHDVEGVVMYKIKLIGFRFEQIYNLRNYDWNDNGIKELAVQYNFDEEQIIVN
jgi:hypothetical protein